MNNSKISSLRHGAMKMAFLTIASVALSACASLPQSGSTVSRSTGLAMSEADYALYLETKNPQELLELKADPAKRLDMAMNLHSTSDLTEQAVAEGIDKDPLVAATLVEARRRVLTTALMDRVGRAVEAPDDETLNTLARERYERDKKKLVTPERRHLAHVLLTELHGCPCKVKRLAERVPEAWKMLSSGGDFAKYARENSQDIGSGKKGGDLGWVTRNGELVREFEDAAFALKAVGDISPPTTTSYGVHIIKLLGLEPPRQLSYEEVEAQLKAKIVAELRFSALQTRRGLAYPDPDTVNVEVIGKLVQQRIDALAPTGVFDAKEPTPGKQQLETPVGAQMAPPPKDPPAATGEPKPGEKP